MTRPAAISPADHHAVAGLLGREPQGDYEIVARDERGAPVVIRNEPFLADGTPMPTSYWLIGAHERLMVSRLETAGGVNRAEAEIGLDVVAEAHARYAAERDARIPPHHAGARPGGGVGGTRIGVKCLHAHYGWYLAGGDDPVGRWVADHLQDAATVSAVPSGAEVNDG